MKSHVTSIPLLLIALSCNTAEPPPPPPPPPPYVRSIELTGDAGVMEIWLRVQFTDTTHPRAFTLFRDGESILSTTLLTDDTLLVDNSLAPNSTYSYKAFRTRDTTMVDSSLQVQLTTMDTTKHEFDWTIELLGDASGSVLTDVAIVSPNDIWAAGEMFLRDSTGQIDPIPYNAARWDGMQWNLLRILFPVFCGQSTFPAATSAVFAFNANDVWIAGAGIIIMQWNGSTFTPLCIPQSVGTGTIKKIWGSSPNSVYCVGNNGTIAYYNGATWQRIESGTTLHVTDIYGAREPYTDDLEIIAVAADQFVSFDRAILWIDGVTVTHLPSTPINYSLSGIWFIPGRRYFVVGSGIYEKTALGETNWRNGPLQITTFYTNAIRGSALNDAYVVGAYGEFLHFNGITWRSFMSQTGLANGQYYAVDVKDNLVVAVGHGNPRAAVARGIRTP